VIILDTDNNGFKIVQLMMENKTLKELEACKHVIDTAYNILEQQYIVLEKLDYYGNRK